MKLTITWRFVALSTLVVALIFAMFNAFVYLEFMNVTIQNEKQVLLSRLFDVERRIAGMSEAAAITDVKRIVPDPRQMVRLLDANHQVMTASSANFLPSWVPQGLGEEEPLGSGVLLYQHYGQRLLLASARVRLKHTFVTLQWFENVELLDRSIAFVFYLLLTGSLGGLALAAIASYFLARYSLQPIREMIATARSITPGDLSSRIDVSPKRRDELSELGHTFNAMLDRLAAAFMRERQFVADASHELRTPLSVLEGYINLLRRWGWNDEDLRLEAVAAIEEEVQHLRLMTGQLLTLAKIDHLGESDQELTKVTAVVKRVTEKWMQLYPQFDWTIECADDLDAYVRMPSLHLEQVLRALLDNARKYTPVGAAISVSVRKGQNRIRLLVKDTGEGIPAEDLLHVTERFYRADKARSRQEGGAGLGLAICKEIIENVQGRLQIASPATGGVEAEVILPLYDVRDGDDS